MVSYKGGSRFEYSFFLQKYSTNSVDSMEFNQEKLEYFKDTSFLFPSLLTVYSNYSQELCSK